MEITENKDRVSPIGLDWYHSSDRKGEYHFFVEPIWPARTESDDKTQIAVEEYIEDKYSKELKTDFFFYEVTSVRKAIIRFKVHNWFRENFLKKPNVEFNPPRTLIWKFKRSFPKLVLKNVNWLTLEKFLTKEFKKFLKEHKKKVFEDKLKLVKKMDMDWFDFDFDLKEKKIYVKMKLSVMMAFAAGVYAIASGSSKKEK